MEEKHVTPIKVEIRHLLEEFLKHEDYQNLFKQFAVVAGYPGDDLQEIRNHLFSVTIEGEIVFAVAGLYDLFMEYQLVKVLIGQPVYGELLKKYPESIRRIRELAKKMLNKEDIQMEDIAYVFDTKSYDRERAEAN